MQGCWEDSEWSSVYEVVAGRYSDPDEETAAFSELDELSEVVRVGKTSLRKGLCSSKKLDRTISPTQ